MLDREGFRPNVGIVLLNARNEVFWGKRLREHSWQFPQGGIKFGETPVQAMYRELHEEVGLKPEHVKVIGRTRDWLRYEVPDRFIRREIRGHYRGQKQIWFLLRMVGRDCDICLRATNHPEFDAWRWNSYWVPLDAVIEFKRDVYHLALTELSRFVRRTQAKAESEPELRVTVSDTQVLVTPDGVVTVTTSATASLSPGRLSEAALSGPLLGPLFGPGSSPLPGLLPDAPSGPADETTASGPRPPLVYK